MENILAFSLGFASATVLIVGVGFFYLKRRWKSLLFGLGSKLFSKGLGHVSERAQRSREVGRQ